MDSRSNLPRQLPCTKPILQVQSGPCHSGKDPPVPKNRHCWRLRRRCNFDRGETRHRSLSISRSSATWYDQFSERHLEPGRHPLRARDRNFPLLWSRTDYRELGKIPCECRAQRRIQNHGQEDAPERGPVETKGSAGPTKRMVRQVSSSELRLRECILTTTNLFDIYQ